MLCPFHLYLHIPHLFLVWFCLIMNSAFKQGPIIARIRRYRSCWWLKSGNLLAYSIVVLSLIFFFWIWVNVLSCVYHLVVAIPHVWDLDWLVFLPLFLLPRCLTVLDYPNWLEFTCFRTFQWGSLARFIFFFPFLNRFASLTLTTFFYLLRTTSSAFLSFRFLYNVRRLLIKFCAFFSCLLVKEIL